MRSMLSARTLLSVVTAAALAASLVGGSADAATPASAVPAVTAAAAPTAPAGVLSTVAQGLRGFDSRGAETSSEINCLSAAGYGFDIIDAVGTAWQGEYNAAAAAGMKVLLFQGYDPSSWATPAEGTRRGAIIANNAVTARYPARAQIFLDLEDTIQPADKRTGTPATSVPELKTWIANWSAAVRAKGYQPGIYAGEPQLLSKADLDSIPNTVYWQPVSSAASKPARGFVGSQTAITQPACGIDGGINLDKAGTDTRGASLLGAAFPKPLAAPTAAGAFAPLSPTRIVDTRAGTGAAGPIAAGKTVDVQVSGRGGIPTSGAGAAVLNVTVTAPTAAGYLSTFPTGAARAQVSSLNFVGRQTVANLVTVRLGAGGKVSLFNGSPGTVQLLADVAGYYLAGTGNQPGTFSPVVPARLLDTRPAGVAALSKTPVGTASRSPIAAGGYDSVVLNVTAVQPTASGYLTAYGANLATPPTASNLNFTARRTVPNMATVPVDRAGRVLIYNGSPGRTDLLADVAGYYRAGTRVDRGAFTPVTPARILDTRRSGKVAASSAIALKVAGAPSVPVGSSAVVLNVTVVRTAAPGFLTVFPSDRSTPQASNINFVAGQNVANQVIVPIGADGRVVLMNSSAGATDLLADVAGYIRG